MKNPNRIRTQNLGFSHL